MNTAVSPTREKSCSETMKVTEPNRRSRLAASDCAHHVARLQRPEIKIVLDGSVLHRGIGVLPRYHEDGESLPDQERDHAVFRLHVHDVVFVDPGWHDQQR